MEGSPEGFGPGLWGLTQQAHVSQLGLGKASGFPQLLTWWQRDVGVLSAWRSHTSP